VHLEGELGWIALGWHHGCPLLSGALAGELVGHMSWGACNFLLDWATLGCRKLDISPHEE